MDRVRFLRFGVGFRIDVLNGTKTLIMIDIGV